MNRNLWDKAQARLKDLYGGNPPVRILERFETEKMLMKGSSLITHFGFLSELVHYSKQVCSHISLRGDTGNSFVAWLLGATDVNPLEPHYLCERCKTVEFQNNVQDGWDLPPKQCSCGHMMRSDGHGLPCEKTLVSLIKRPNFEIKMPPDLLAEAEKHLQQYFADKAQIARVRLADAGDFFYLLDQDEQLPPDTITWEEHARHYADKPYYNFSSPQLEYVVQKLCRMTHRTPESIDFMSEEVIAAFQKADIPPILVSDRSIIPFLHQIQPTCFSHILKAEGLRCATGAWEGNQEQLYKTGVLNNDDLIAFREDVYDTVMAAMKDCGYAGSGLALNIMAQAYIGKFASKGMPLETEQTLQELGVPSWFTGVLKKIKYLFPKAHCISCMHLEMIIMWFCLYEKEAFGELVSAIQLQGK